MLVCGRALAGEPAAKASGPGPVKVFLLIGQSNMNGRGNIKMLREKLCKDLPKAYPPSLMALRKDVWLFGANGDGISGQKDNWCLEPGFGQWKWYGPELGFGHRMGEKFAEQVLIIKVFGGGTSLGKSWLPPTAAKRKGKPVGPMYKRLIRETITTLTGLGDVYRLYDPKQGYQVAGAFWVQGHADRGKLREQYEDNLVDFIQDIRRDLHLPKLPFVAAESLSGAPASESYTKAVDRVNKAAGDKQAVAICTKSRINLASETYAPYNASGDRTHWRHNSRAYLDVGYWAAEAIGAILPPAANHARDAELQAAWKKALAAVGDSPAK